MKKKSASQLKMGKVIICLILLFSMGVLTGCIGQEQLKVIEKTANIPYHQSGTLEIGVGSAGTLHCTGTIVETDQGVESITLIWKADVTFPGDSVAGAIWWDGLFGEHPKSYGDTDLILALAPPWELTWEHAKGEHHIWQCKIEIEAEDMDYEILVDGTVYEAPIPGGMFVKISNIENGRYEIYSVFASSFYSRTSPHYNPADPYTIDIITPSFYLVREGNNFWFE